MRTYLSYVVMITLVLIGIFQQSNLTFDWSKDAPMVLILAASIIAATALFIRSNRRVFRAYIRKPGWKLLMRVIFGKKRKKAAAQAKQLL